MAIISLREMEFQAFHGVYAVERQQGNRFRVTVQLEVPDAVVRQAATSDDLAHTLDYSAVYGIVAKGMEAPVNLLETLAVSYADQILGLQSYIERVTVFVEKLAPPLGGPCVSSGVSFTASRAFV